VHGGDRDGRRVREASEAWSDAPLITKRLPLLGLGGAVPVHPDWKPCSSCPLTLGMHPGERSRRWEHVDLDGAVIHVWRSARRGSDANGPEPE
jgi:hypothetical protein